MRWPDACHSIGAPLPPITQPPLEPEEKPIVVHDEGLETDEEHDIDKTAGDEGIDDDVKDDHDDDGADENQPASRRLKLH